MSEKSCRVSCSVANYISSRRRRRHLFYYYCIYVLLAERRRREAISAATSLTEALVDHLNVGYEICNLCLLSF